MSKHYFEVSEPYYALIKVDSGEEAEKLYNEFVADTVKNKSEIMIWDGSLQ